MRHAASSCLALLVLGSTTRALGQPRGGPRDADEVRESGDGPRDFERLPALPRVSEPVPLRLPVALSLLAWRNVTDQSTELGVGAVLSLPLDVIALAPRRVELAPAQFLPVSVGVDQRAPLEVVEEVRLAPSAVRRLVRAAWSTARLAPEEERLGDLAARSRAAAALPELRLRVIRMVNESLRLTATDDVGTTATGVGMHYEARATWRLDRLVFADDEVALERLRSERNAERLRLTLHVLELVTAWQRAHARALDTSLPAYERADAAVREVAAATTLDALTDGAWSRAE